jgi:hypothetical protein
MNVLHKKLLRQLSGVREITEAITQANQVPTGIKLDQGKEQCPKGFF